MNWRAIQAIYYFEMARTARTLLQTGVQRDRLTAGIYIAKEATSALGRLEHAMQLCSDSEPVLKKLKEAVRHGRLPKARPEQLLDQAVESGIITEAEEQLVHAAEAARSEAIAVDSFTLAEYLHSHKGASEHASSPGAVSHTAAVAE